ncbi:hypothetical protein [Lacinutrix himadriensis]|uniref:hypothetical protein n=1 Tax=Lacinutrix himadriensis TaxID=641549 RepID=UPI0006E462C6|nr:hypothetical protein [Lacinutrix himadriensis]
MNNIEIFEKEIITENQSKFAIFKCNSIVEYPKQILDTAVSKYVGNKGYNQFIEIYNDNHWIRIIISGINEFEYTKLEHSSDNVEYFQYNLMNGEENKNSSFSILRGGLKSERPLEFMNNEVLKYAKGKTYMHFIEIHRDNPWVRLVLFGIDNLHFVNFSNQRL